jgi:two-component sensor histidine kinase/CheY-like chemotaxis protein
MTRPALRTARAERAARARRTLAAPPVDLASAQAAFAAEILADAVVHEAAQPMQALSSILREMQALARQRAPEALERIDALTDEGGRLLDELRRLQDELRAAGSLARGERQRATYLRQEFAALAARLQPPARAMHMALRLSSGDYWLRIDAVALRRIVKILVANAIQHSGASSIRVRAFSDGRGLLLAVRDDGAGIEEARLAGLFAVPAELAGPEAWRARRGFGLFIVRLMLARMGGTLSVRTSADGTTFFVHWPRQVLRAPLGPTRPAGPARAMEGHVIVMLDDDARALAASARLFETLGARVLTFTEPLDLLAAAPRLPQPPALFILDYRLRDGTCARVIEALRHWLKEDFHCVVLTGDDAVSDALAELRREVFVATKPLDDWTLAHIERFLRGDVERMKGGREDASG